MDTPTVVTSEAHLRHDPPYELNAGRTISPVWERPARVEVIDRALRDAGHRVVAPRPFGDEVVTAVHDPDMVRWLDGAYDSWRGAGGPEVMIADTYALRSWTTARYPSSPLAQLGWWCMDTATPLVAGSYGASRAAVDVALTAAELAVAGDATTYALVRPPGHHAGPDYFGGFCILNVAAVTAHHLTAGGRVAILDVDYHHGNGTQDVFWRRDDVLYVSLHADPAGAYPYFTGREDEVGEAAGRGATVNLPLPPTTEVEDYLGALRTACERIAAWGPTSLVVSLGFDTFHDDPIAGLGVTTEAYEQVGRTIAGLDLPTVLVQEGGYAVDHLAANALSLLTGITAG